LGKATSQRKGVLDTVPNTTSTLSAQTIPLRGERTKERKKEKPRILPGERAGRDRKVIVADQGTHTLLTLGYMFKRRRVIREIRKLD